MDLTPVPIGSDTQVNTFASSNRLYPAVAALADGGFIVTWSSFGQDGSDWGVYGQRYDSTGATVGTEFRINTFTGDVQTYSSVTALASGGFVVTWTSYFQDGSSTGVYGQRFDPRGDAVGGEFRVNATTSDSQDYSSVVALSDGGYLVTWSSFQQDTAGYGIFGQRYDANGTAVGTEFRANTFVASNQVYSSAAVLIMTR